MDELVLSLSPVAPKQILFTVKNGSIVEEKELPLELNKIVTAIGFLGTKYGIKSVKVVGNKSFAEKFVAEISNALTSSRYTVTDMVVTYLNV